MTTPAYGNLIRIDAANANGSAPEILRPVPLDAGAAAGGVSEQTLQDLLFRYPQALPIADIDAAYADAVPICTELSLPAGYADALYLNHFGKITLAEFKLWRNPQARREVIGQILDYAKDLASWHYEDLQRQVSLARRQTGNAPYDLVRAHCPDLNESEFVDNVTRHLRRGEFLLLIIGDGIREDAARIVDFVQQYSGLHFNLALVEAALYRDPAGHLIVQPRIQARTEIVQRFVVNADFDRVVPADVITDAAAAEPLTDWQQQCVRFWNAVLQDYSFADTTVRVPADLWPIPPQDSTLSVMVKDSGFGGWALTFNGYLRRSRSESRTGIGCYLTPRKDQEREVRIFNDLAKKESLDELRRQLPGLEYWDDLRSGRPRIGFRRQTSLAFLAEDAESADFRDAVAWMQEHLNRLVSALHPRLPAMLKSGR